MNYRENENFYNDGVVFQEPCAMRSLVCPCSVNCSKKPYRLAVFDMDGTSINASSPSILVKKLISEKRLSLANTAYIAKWALTYKFHLPRENNKVREKVFTAFAGKDALEVSRELEQFAEEKIVPHIRKSATELMKKHIEDGIVVILLSASFDSVLSKMMLHMPVNYGIASLMRIDCDGKMTNEVQGTAPEGDGKPEVLKTFANAVFGEGNWVVDYAYGDHMSDDGILNMAKHPVAVCPDRQLLKHAQNHNWQIVYW